MERRDDWIAVDRGTTRLRARRVSGDGDVRVARASDAGMGALSPDGVEPALRELPGHEIEPGRTRRAPC